MADEMTQRALKSLGDPTRLRIVEFLSGMCCGTAAVDEDGGVYQGPTASEVCCQITGAEKITSTISHHLHELEASGLVRIERRGKKMLCKLRADELRAVGDYLHSLAKGETTDECC